MTLSHYTNENSVGMEIIVDYNTTHKKVEEVISIIVTDVTDMAEIDIAPILYHKFPNTINYLVDSINWNKEYEKYLSQVKM